MSDMMWLPQTENGPEVMIGIDYAVPGGDMTKFMCMKCHAILDDIKAVDEHDCRGQ